MKDYWVTDTGRLSDDSGDPLYHIALSNNNSYWISESGTYVSDVLSSTFLEDWIDSGIASEVYVCDKWYDDDSAIQTIAVAADARVACSFWRLDNSIAGTSNQTNPVLKFPTMEFTVTLPEPNVYLYFKFGYATGYANGKANVYIKNGSLQSASWECVNKKSGTTVPIEFVDQSTLAEADRWSGTGALATFIQCGKKVGYSNVNVKIEFMPGDNDTDNINSGGIFYDCYIGSP
jgi:hypothetical protein